MHLPGLVSLLLLSAPVLAAEPKAQDKESFEAELQRTLETFEQNMDRSTPIPCGNPPMRRPERISGEDLQFDPRRLAHLDEDETHYLLTCTFKLDGTVTSCRILKPALSLDASNRETLKQWRFKPAIYKDKPIATTCTLSGKLTPRPEN
ncbi:energy transducer TonB [Myxococcus sp. NMCA1]|uniref:energy transducer TonB n=1 Tax=Myxococcus sp. NMCA1 TaxID=2996785 RepID=UPI002285A92A|nr:energy transducer TonB [Myxococcus sp. NMCA1]WAM26221.1 energy transducer TonB [Myxococcus sp. NMCA1]